MHVEPSSAWLLVNRPGLRGRSGVRTTTAAGRHPYPQADETPTRPGVSLPTDKGSLLGDAVAVLAAPGYSEPITRDEITTEVR